MVERRQINKDALVGIHNKSELNVVRNFRTTLLFDKHGYNQFKKMKEERKSSFSP